MDDIGWNDLGFMNPLIKTPTIDELATKQGARQPRLAIDIGHRVAAGPCGEDCIPAYHADAPGVSS